MSGRGRVYGAWLAGLLMAVPALAAPPPGGLSPGAAAALERPLPAARANSVAVLYPELGEPYRAIFNALIDGIAEQTGPVRRQAITPATDIPALQAQLQRSGVRVVVALGRQGLQAALGLEKDLPVVVGGVVSVPEAARERQLPGISLTPDPAVLFAQLRELLPSVRRVVVVYNPAHTAWLLSPARSAARAQGLELVEFEARDVASAARHYQALLGSLDGRRDALWLPQDPTTVDDELILPLVLRKAWSRGVPVFSSSFPHVKKGALFALYPDNRALGRSLGARALRLQADEPVPPGMQPLQDVLRAINLRTAGHLGLALDHPQQRRFDLVFPEP